MKEKIIKTNIHSLFSTPIYITQLNRKFSNTEYKFIEKSKIKPQKNEGNYTSNENYILNTKSFSNLKKELVKVVKDYFHNVMSVSNNIDPYITQSWLNYTNTNQYHHKHSHPNSIVSGVLYINADKKNDKIKFFKSDYKIIKLPIKKYNLWNSESWWFPVETGELFLFPSSLTHMVENKQGTNTRISLSFNTFVKGTIGVKKDLTELIL
jgi:uncharacterized protein (TIGR02466 family)